MIRLQVGLVDLRSLDERQRLFQGLAIEDALDMLDHPATIAMNDHDYAEDGFVFLHRLTLEAGL